MSSESLRVGPYELLTPIAQSDVFIAQKGGARVALKLQKALPDHAAVQRFFDAARTAARLSHPRIVPIEDVGESDGRIYLAMPLVECISLARLIRLMRDAQTQLPIPIVRRIADGLLDALAFAHAKEPALVHGAVAPSNVLLTAAGEVLVSDFGLAEAARAEHELRKKGAYLSPEQVRGGLLGPKADVFSAAVTLYETATLSSPFLHAGDAESMEAVVTRTQPSANTLRHELSERAALALDRAMQKDPERRFGTIRQLRERFVDGELATAEELGALVQTWGKDDLRVFTAVPAPAAPAPAPSLAVTRRRRVRVPALLILTAAIAAAAGVIAWFRPVAPPPVLPLPPPPPPTPEPRPIAPVPVEPSE